MARKHNIKSRRIKTPIEFEVIRHELPSPIVTEVPEGTDGAIAIPQDDGSVKFFTVERFRFERRQGKARGSTLKPRNERSF